MQPMLVYRFLRKVSDWTMSGFYSEVLVTGQENVPSDGPLIIAATHHNEIIDIAALSVTIPHRRRLCYWAKSSLFKNPVSGGLLTSAGSIPVHRNPNSSTNGNGTPNSAPGYSQAALFRETSATLANGEVVGVFPEGTSYTEPRIVQVKDGAAWAAVEYAKTVKFNGTTEDRGTTRKDLLIVPAAVVYTDKSQYQSRVCVSYGKPIEITPYAARLVPDDEDNTRIIVKEITAEIEVRLRQLTINAPDWDALNSARVARDLLERDGPCKELAGFVQLSQSLVSAFAVPEKAPSSLSATTKSLTSYLALLHFSGISHATLNSLYPLSVFKFPKTLPARTTAFYVFLSQLCGTLFHPRALAFLPAFLIHIPAYACGWLGARLLSPLNEEESKAQFKAIFGGIGMAATYGMLTRSFIKTLVNLANSGTAGTSSSWVKWIPPDLFDVMARFGHILSGSNGGVEGVIKSTLGSLTLMYGTTRVCWTWHNALVKGNYTQIKRLIASYKVFSGLLSPHSSDVSLGKLEPYLHVPLPAENPYIKKRNHDGSPPSASTPLSYNGSQPPPSIPSRKLVRHLLHARIEADDALGKYLDEYKYSVSFGEGDP
ncbi:hypothetical protein BJ138DRAFT_1054610 [Hygrophoropsis aurantiaca]|uniref:Uncharacterized protein n=1 Tax=Hygrophoropsis aurantiaca TaxID=72124 RepID=A0ACB8AQI1_9AGAM|nr:hypothetical protein BJ138DRAFT_1054610 [Hygrophoropsis aurantiaca]